MRQPTGRPGLRSRLPACRSLHDVSFRANADATMAGTSLAPSWRLDRRIAAALENAAHADPFAVLGPHNTSDGRVVRAFVPGALGIEVLKRADRVPLGRLNRSGIEDLFEGLVSDAEPYLLRISRPGGVQDTEDPYAFGALLGEHDLHLFNEGRHFELTGAVSERCPGAMMIAEESTAWPGVTRPISEGGLGFSYKWNMGWMHDTLRYMEHDPIHRPYHHGDITFGLLYAFSERFMLPLSHDEVVHGKRSLIGKMPGDPWQRLANLRTYLGFMWAHPGKKLLFMGGEIAEENEWSHDGEVEWYRLGEPAHAGIQRLLRDLNRLYASTSALHQRDCEASGFRWVIGDDRANSVFAFLRLAADASSPILSVCNMTPVPRHGYRVGVPRAGIWREIFNSDSGLYGGSNMGNAGAVHTTQGAMHGEQQSLDLVLPPLSTVLLRHEA